MSVYNALRHYSARAVFAHLNVLPWNGHQTAAGFVHHIAQPRRFSLAAALHKKRKTAEERKAEENIRTPIRIKNKITTFGVVDIWRNMTVQDLAGTLKKDLEHVQEVMLYIKDADNLEPHARLEDMKIIREIALKCGHKTKVIAAPSRQQDDQPTVDRDVHPRGPPADASVLRPRPPVVTVMGHVDHGKTTLLDSLRGASVAAGEAGGITQHIGAFTVRLGGNDENGTGGEEVTFLDTPGHAAFSAMRARGANCTDIIVLVVAADDGVMEQTREVIGLALDAGVPIIVAVNKIDKPAADVERTKRGLLQQGIALEGHGGDVQLVEISALMGTGLTELAECIGAQATLMGLRSEPVGAVEGVVVESKTDKLRGKLSTSIVTRGTLRRGAVLVSGQAWAKVRGLFDHTGRPLDAAPPGTPVEILGWRELPAAGDTILEVDSERKAHSVIAFRAAQSLADRATGDLDAIRAKEEQHNAAYRAQREARRQAGGRRLRLATRPKESAADDGTPRVNVILKADVHGSAEAILDVLDTYQAHDRCRLNVVHYGVGDVSDGDLELGRLFDAVVYAFAVDTAAALAVPKGVRVRQFDIIYRLVDDLRAEINAKLPSIEVEDVLGEANVLQIFEITEGKREVTVLGCRCVKGVLKKASRYKLVRQGEVIHDGQLESMRHLKNEVDTIRSGVECGLRLNDQEVVAQNGDTLVCYTTKMMEQKTDWDPGF